MALKPSSLRLLEDEFVCQCSYPDDVSYVAQLEAKLVPRWVRAKRAEDERAENSAPLRPEKRKAKA